MTIEGLGKKFQEARLARNLTLDEAARMTKIRPARLAEIEADDFSQFPSLAYAKGFLLIYGKFLDVDVTPYLDAFEDSERMTGDGYSYLQENRPQKPVAAPVVRRRRPTTTSHERISPMPLIFGVLVLVIGFSVMKFILNVRRLAPGQGESTAQVSPNASLVPSPKDGHPAATEASPGTVAPAPTVAPPAPSEAATSPVASAGPPEIRKALAASAAPSQPEVRRAKPLTSEDVGTAQETTNSSSAESGEQNRVAIRPLKRTYVKVTVGDKGGSPAFERWVSPADGPVEFHGKHVSIRVLDPDAVQITKNGKALEDNDEDVTVN
ncbi:MAG TPA: helix-turn-helix domain-containing protein [Candidatus Acidoferrum sp.]|nr:helix-turn-helix domain-containing protein [Candidatus Acidoferrum sp.]